MQVLKPIFLKPYIYRYIKLLENRLPLNCYCVCVCVVGHSSHSAPEIRRFFFLLSLQYVYFFIIIIRLKKTTNSCANIFYRLSFFYVICIYCEPFRELLYLFFFSRNVLFFLFDIWGKKKLRRMRQML